MGKRDVSDHCPIFLKGDGENWGSKPFCFTNCWLQHSGFRTLVENFWSTNHVNGWKIHAFREKLKRLKECIKVWSVEVYGNLDSQIKSLVDVLNASDERAAVASLDNAYLITRRNTVESIWKLKRQKLNLMDPFD